MNKEEMTVFNLNPGSEALIIIGSSTMPIMSLGKDDAAAGI
ncbi:MAG: hypothetical protein RXR16_04825 [Thermocladium sp.]